MGKAEDWKLDPGIAAWSAFLRAHAAAVRRIDGEVQRRTGLPLAWYDVLLELNAAPGRRMRMQDLGDSVVLSRTRVSRVVDDLVAAGLVSRLANPDDRRSSYAAIAPEGRRALRRAAPVYLRCIREHFVGPLEPSRAALVRDAMTAVVEHNDPARPVVREETPRR